MKKIPQSVFLAFSSSVILLMMNGCAPASTPALLEPFPANTSQPVNEPQVTDTLEPSPLPEEILSNDPLTIAEVEQLSGFDVKEPTYLPKGVSFDFATYQELPSPNSILHFKLKHEQFGDMGAFFQVMQELQTEAPPDTISCGNSVEGCKILQIGNVTAIYRLNTSGTEGLDWYANGFSFKLLRTAGEPNKIYKDELIKVVDSMK